MYYYLLSALIFRDGNVKDGVNCIYRSKSASDIIDFRNHIASNYADPPNTYSSIIIPMWQEIPQEVYDNYEQRFSEENLQKISERKNIDQ